MNASLCEHGTKTAQDTEEWIYRTKEVDSSTMNTNEPQPINVIETGYRHWKTKPFDFENKPLESLGDPQLWLCNIKGIAALSHKSAKVEIVLLI